MKDYANENDQLENIEKFKSFISDGIIDFAFIQLSSFFHQTIENMKNTLIEGKKVAYYEIYNTHYPIFKEISEKTVDKFNFFEAFGFSCEEINELKKALSGNGDKEKASEIIMDKMDIDVKDGRGNIQNKEVEVLQKVFDRVTPEINKKIVEYMYFSNEEINRIVNGINDYMEFNSKNKCNPDDRLREYVSLKLYSDAFEIYLKVLKEIYSKFYKIKIKDIDNNKLYEFFDKNYPILLDSVNNRLRNDVCHLTYKVRGNYTIEQIDEERKIIFLKALTGIIVRNIFIVEFFDKSLKNDKRY